MRLKPLLCVVLGAASQWAISQPAQPPAMDPNAKPSFEVATIKPSQPDERRAFIVEGPRLRTVATTLAELMTFAYSIHSAQVIGGPAWIRVDRYDLVMQPDVPGRASTAQMRVVLQQLLADRFQLTVHHESKELEVYSMVPSKHGPRLTPVTPEEAAGNFAVGGAAPGRILVKNATLAEFANVMNRYMDLAWPVVDDTHIVGKFDFEVKWTPQAVESGGRATTTLANDAGAAQDLFAAMDEQLGLELKAHKEPSDVLVIDGVQRASEN